MEVEQANTKIEAGAEACPSEDAAITTDTGNNNDSNNTAQSPHQPLSMEQPGASPTPVAMTPGTPNGSASQMEALDSESASSSPVAPFVPRVINQSEGERVDKGHPERKRRASNDSMDSSLTKVSEGNNDDNDDDDNEDDDDKLSPGENIDPERLKAFNMFVRLFVDENLDRMVPISKQPKEKVQAILEACDRQFPEFRERSRKRIRTYLKSCRRLKKKDVNGQEVAIKQTPPHLTSAAAENILAQACENESHNAKRMRMGLEPLPANLMINNTTSQTTIETPSPSPGTSVKLEQREQTVSPAREMTMHSRITNPRHRVSPHLTAEKKHMVATDYSQSAKTPTMFRTPQEMTSHFLTNGSGLFRPGFPTAYTPSAHSSLLQSSSILSSQLQNGPTDLSMKNKSSSAAASGSHSASSPLASRLLHQQHPLSASELATIKQLIAGYRESAAFLYRSADELEQILAQQHQ